MTHSNDTRRRNQGMMYKPEPRYSHLSFGPSKQALPVHSPIVMETVSAVLNMFCSLLPAKLLSGVHHYLTKSLSPSLMALSTSVAISSSLSATHTSLLFLSLSRRPQSLYFPSTINLSEPSVIVESSHFFSRISWVQCVFIISTSLLQELSWPPPMSRNVCPLPQLLYRCM